MGLGRRDFLKFSGTFAASLGVLSIPSLLQEDKTSFRPPGSVEEPNFLKRCILCQKCVEVCPTGFIKATSFAEGIKNFKTPTLEYTARPELKQQDPATEEEVDKWMEEGDLSENWKTGVLGEGLPIFSCIRCGKCVEACPTGAIKNIPLEEIDMGTAEILEDRCLAYASPGTCLQCDAICPIDDAVVVEEGEPTIDQELCIGCGQCYGTCPVDDPGVAIEMIPEKANRPSP